MRKVSRIFFAFSKMNNNIRMIILNRCEDFKGKIRKIRDSGFTHIEYEPQRIFFIKRIEMLILG